MNINYFGLLKSFQVQIFSVSFTFLCVVVILGILSAVFGYDTVMRTVQFLVHAIE